MRQVVWTSTYLSFQIAFQGGHQCIQTEFGLWPVLGPTLQNSTLFFLGMIALDVSDHAKVQSFGRMLLYSHFLRMRVFLWDHIHGDTSDRSKVNWRHLCWHHALMSTRLDHSTAQKKAIKSRYAMSSVALGTLQQFTWHGASHLSSKYGYDQESALILLPLLTMAMTAQAQKPW